MKILFVALEFAPVQQTGAFRSIGFAQHLPSHGIQPVVLTVDPGDASSMFGASINESLVPKPPPPTYYLRDCKPLHTESRLARFLRLKLSFNDSYYRRLRPSISEVLKQATSEHDVSAAYVSLPPFGASEVALEVVERTGLPLIVDMRDAWSQWSHQPFASYAHFRSALAGERRLLSKAHAIVTVTEELKEMFVTQHSQISADKFHVVPNGMDEISTSVECSWSGQDDEFRIAYVGSYYYDPVSDAQRNRRWFQRRPSRWLNYFPEEQHWLYRSPYFLFKAIATLRATKPELAAKIKFCHIGNAPIWLKEMAKQFGLEDQVELVGRVPKEAVGEMLSTMDAALVTSIKVPGGLDYCLASKTFDYICASKLLLGFVADGAQKRFLEAVGGAEILDPDDSQTAADRLAELVKRDQRYRFDTQILHEFRRDSLAKKLAQIIKNVACPRKP